VPASGRDRCEPDARAAGGVAGGEITKAARNWIGNNLDASKRSQIMFLDRDDILNLYVVANLPLPAAAIPVAADPWTEDPPF
jgi:hypothetical protein